MDDRFDDRSRKVLSLAREEARRLGKDQIGTEHILLALVREGGASSRVLLACGFATGKADTELHKLGKKGLLSMVMTSPTSIHFTHRSERMLDHAVEEARALRQVPARPEHILLGLLRQPEGGGAKTLTALGLDLAKLREAVLQSLQTPPKP